MHHNYDTGETMKESTDLILTRNIELSDDEYADDASLWFSFFSSVASALSSHLQ